MSTTLIERVYQYSVFDFKKLKSDYHSLLSFLFYFFFFFIPFILTYFIYTYTNINGLWIIAFFMTAFWTLAGLFLLIRPLILRIVFPSLLFLLSIVIGVVRILQATIVVIAEDIEKRITKGHLE